MNRFHECSMPLKGFPFKMNDSNLDLVIIRCMINGKVIFSLVNSLMNLLAIESGKINAS